MMVEVPYWKVVVHVHFVLTQDGLPLLGEMNHHQAASLHENNRAKDAYHSSFVNFVQQVDKYVLEYVLQVVLILFPTKNLLLKLF
jgi:hypothetical protein